MTAVDLRPFTSSDEPFVHALILRTLEEELAAWAWPEPMRSQLLEVQYRGRVDSVRASYPESIEQVILLAGHSVGRLVVSDTPAEIHVLDIAVLPEHRNAGIGGNVLTRLIEAGERTARPVRLSVNTSNRAQNLYSRLGFVRIGGTEVQQYLEWTAQSPGLTQVNAPPSFLHPDTPITS